MIICVPIPDIEAFMTSAAYPESNTSTTKIVEINPFCYNDQKYKCLCQKIHIKVGTYFFAYLTIFSYIAASILAWILETHIIVSVGITTLAIFGTLTSLLLIYGVKKEKRQFSIPYLIFCVLSIIVLVAFIILCILALINRDNEDFKNFLYPSQENQKLNENQREYLATNISILITIASLFLLLSIWAFFIVFRTYKFIGDILAARRPMKAIRNTESI